VKLELLERIECVRGSTLTFTITPFLTFAIFNWELNSGGGLNNYKYQGGVSMLQVVGEESSNKYHTL
jgi:hypothetical protein